MTNLIPEKLARLERHIDTSVADLLADYRQLQQELQTAKERADKAECDMITLSKQIAVANQEFARLKAEARSLEKPKVEECIYGGLVDAISKVAGADIPDTDEVAECEAQVAEEGLIVKLRSIEALLGMVDQSEAVEDESELADLVFAKVDKLIQDRRTLKDEVALLKAEAERLKGGIRIVQDSCLAAEQDYEAKLQQIGEAVEGLIKIEGPNDVMIPIWNRAVRELLVLINSIKGKSSQEMGQPVASVESSESAADKESTCWFVESRIQEKFDGWFAAPKIGIGGWNTSDPHEAKQYTKAEAEAVAHALTYFHVPFNWCNWIATEHVFAGLSNLGTDTETGTTPKVTEK